MSVLHADSISKTYSGRRILTSATVKLDAGTITGLLGRMGTGKSTLLRICAGLTLSDTGWVKFRNVLYLRPSLTTLATHGLYYLAESGNLAERLTVRDHIIAIERRFGSNGLGFDFKIDQLMDSYPHMLSGGERRRVELALATQRNPTCLIVDEVFKGLDPVTAEFFGQVFRALAKRGCALLLAGHQARLLADCVDSVVWVTSGTAYPLGAPRKAWDNEQFRREYLGPIVQARRDERNISENG